MSQTSFRLCSNLDAFCNETRHLANEEALDVAVMIVKVMRHQKSIQKSQLKALLDQLLVNCTVRNEQDVLAIASLAEFVDETPILRHLISLATEYCFSTASHDHPPLIACTALKRTTRDHKLDPLIIKGLQESLLTPELIVTAWASLRHPRPPLKPLLLTSLEQSTLPAYLLALAERTECTDWLESEVMSHLSHEGLESETHHKQLHHSINQDPEMFSRAFRSARPGSSLWKCMHALLKKFPGLLDTVPVECFPSLAKFLGRSDPFLVRKVEQRMLEISACNDDLLALVPWLSERVGRELINGRVAECWKLLKTALDGFKDGHIPKSLATQCCGFYSYADDELLSEEIFPYFRNCFEKIKPILDVSILWKLRKKKPECLHLTLERITAAESERSLLYRFTDQELEEIKMDLPELSGSVMSEVHERNLTERKRVRFGAAQGIFWPDVQSSWEDCPIYSPERSLWDGSYRFNSNQ